MTSRKPKQIGDYPFINVVFSISIALFLVGLFLLFSFYTRGLSQYLRANFQVQVFISNGKSYNEILEIQDQIRALAFVAKGEESVVFVHQDTLAARYLKRTGEDFAEVLEANPFRHKFDVRLSGEDYQEAELAEVKQKLEAVGGVFEVVVPYGQLKEVSTNLRWLGWVVAVLVSILLVLVFFLVDNAIRLALYSQRFLIRSMQLVGATIAFIKKPYLMRSALIGLVSGGVSSVLLLLLHIFLASQWAGLGDLLGWGAGLLIFFLLLSLGVGLVLLSTNFSLDRYLKMELDQLY